MKSRYDMMTASTQCDSFGNAYPDVLSLDISDKKFTTAMTVTKCTQAFKDAFYLVCYAYYGYCYLDDLLMWLNGISDADTLVVGETLYVPSAENFSSYYDDRRVS